MVTFLVMNKVYPRKVDATILFCDIRGFTRLFDQVDPLEAFTFAGSVLAGLGRIVESCGGAIDKFTGDGFLAHFGVLIDDPKHAEHACSCALRLKAAEEIINTERYLGDMQVISTGIGLNSGVVAAGMIETTVVREFTVLGDTVNMAARIENLTRLFHVDILLSASTAAQVAGIYELKLMEPAHIRGKGGKHATYWLLPTNTPAETSR